MKVKITETVLRDSQQSLIATRMPFSDFEGILETLDNAGYYSLECWGTTHSSAGAAQHSTHASDIWTRIRGRDLERSRLSARRLPFRCSSAVRTF